MATEKNTRKKLPAFTSPVATFRYPKLTEPDYGNKDYPKPDGEYSVQFILDAAAPETKKLLSQLQPIYEEAMADAKKQFSELKAETRKKLKNVTENSFFTEILDQETEEPTGQIMFKAAMKASGVSKKGPKVGKKWERKPMIFDAHGARMTKLPDIWSGTEGCVAFEVSSYFIPGTAAAGIKLNLIGVQIINLVSGGQRSAESLGFGKHDGYAHDDSAFDNSSNTSSAADADDANEAEDF